MTTKIATLVMVALLGACGGGDRSSTTSTTTTTKTTTAAKPSDQWISAGCSDKPAPPRPVVRVEAPASCSADSLP